MSQGYPKAVDCCGLICFTTRRPIAMQIGDASRRTTSPNLIGSKTESRPRITCYLMQAVDMTRFQPPPLTPFKSDLTLANQLQKPDTTRVTPPRSGFSANPIHSR